MAGCVKLVQCPLNAMLRKQALKVGEKIKVLITLAV